MDPSDPRSVRSDPRYAVSSYYKNTPTQYKCFFCCAGKIENVHLKKFDIFLIFAQNIDGGFMLELPW